MFPGFWVLLRSSVLLGRRTGVQTLVLSEHLEKIHVGVRSPICSPTRPYHHPSTPRGFGPSGTWGTTGTSVQSIGVLNTENMCFCTRVLFRHVDSLGTLLKGGEYCGCEVIYLFLNASHALRR